MFGTLTTLLLHFVRLGLKIVSGNFEEDLTKIVGGVGFQRFLIKPEIVEIYKT